MRSTSKRAVLFFAALVACAGPPATVSIAPTRPQAPRSTATPPPPLDRCKAVLAAQRDGLVQSIASDRKSSPDEFRDVRDDAALAEAALESSGIVCYAFRGGSWSLELAPGEEVHVDPNGKTAHAKLVAVARIGDARAQSSDPIEIGFGELSSKLAGDYDGDGVPELYVGLHREGPEGGERHDAKIYTVAHGNVVAYAPAAAIAIDGPPFDADGDGRLDLPTSDGLAIGAPASCDGYKSYADDAHLLAHARPDGTFSIDDAVAKAWARKTCPRSPAAIASPQDALCARLWSHSPAGVTTARARVTSSCAQWDCDLEQKHKPQPRGAARDCDARKETFDQRVPFTLP